MGCRSAIEPANVDTTSLVNLRALSPDDAGAIFAAVDASRAELGAWMSWCSPSYALPEAETWVQYALATTTAGRAQQYLIEEAGRVVGVVGFEDIRDASATLGYWVATPYSGRGLGRQAVRAALALGVADLRLREFVAVIAEGNTRSRRLIAALGFTERPPRVPREVGAGSRLYVYAAPGGDA